MKGNIMLGKKRSRSNDGITNIGYGSGNYDAFRYLASEDKYHIDDFRKCVFCDEKKFCEKTQQKCVSIGCVYLCKVFKCTIFRICDETNCIVKEKIELDLPFVKTNNKYVVDGIKYYNYLYLKRNASVDDIPKELLIEEYSMEVYERDNVLKILASYIFKFSFVKVDEIELLISEIKNLYTYYDDKYFKKYKFSNELIEIFYNQQWKTMMDLGCEECEFVINAQNILQEIASSFFSESKMFYSNIDNKINQRTIKKLVWKLHKVDFLKEDVNSIKIVEMEVIDILATILLGIESKCG